MKYLTREARYRKRYRIKYLNMRRVNIASAIYGLHCNPDLERLKLISSFRSEWSEDSVFVKAEKYTT